MQRFFALLDNWDTFQRALAWREAADMTKDELDLDGALKLINIYNMERN